MPARPDKTAFVAGHGQFMVMIRDLVYRQSGNDLLDET